MPPTKRLLLISYYFPPLGGSGVFRPLRLARYLPRHGWQVDVLTVSDRVRVLKDPSLVQDVPPDTVVQQTGTLELRNLLLVLKRIGLGGLVRRLQPWLMIPDEQRGWVPIARRAGAGMIAERGHRALISTSAPYSAHLVGSLLHRATGVPWVADFRDEWTTNPYLENRYPTGWHRRYCRGLERRVLQEADRVVCVSRPWLDSLRSVAPEEPEEKFRVLPNGYDAAHFPTRTRARPDRFRVVYTGAFYGHRSPGTFLEGVRRALDDDRIPSDDLEVVLMGHTAGADRLRETTGANVRVIEQRPYREALRLLDDAAALLLVVPRAGGAGNHTGKLFPYLASGRPILALAPEPNVAADLVRESRSGLVVDPDDAGAVADALVQLHRAWRGDRALPERNPAAIEAYEADRQAAEWARMLDRLSEEGTTAHEATAANSSISLRETTSTE